MVIVVKDKTMKDEVNQMIADKVTELFPDHISYSIGWPSLDDKHIYMLVTAVFDKGEPKTKLLRLVSRKPYRAEE
jgi:hypothetical protein